MSTALGSPAPEAPSRVWKAIILDVDGVISPLGNGTTAWGDDTTVDSDLGPLVISPSMCQAIDRLDGYHGATCFWLTDWNQPMRHSVGALPGRHWPAIADPTTGPAEAQSWAGGQWARCPWWKWWAVDRWLDSQPHLGRLVWVDDDLRPYRHQPGTVEAGLRSRSIDDALAPKGVDAVLLAPDRSEGLRPLDIAIIEEIFHGGM